MHSTRVITALRLSMFVLLLAAIGLAQSLAGGRIQGTVMDSSGAVIVGASLTATNVATGTTFNVTSNDAGLYTFPILPVGTYELAGEKQGFGKSKIKVQVTVGSNIDLPLTFRVATESELTVSSEAPVVETTRSNVAATVNEKAIHELPVNGRNFLDFVMLTPGVNRDPNRTGDLSFGGLRGTLNSLTVDGADNNNTFFGQTSGRTGSGRAPYQFSNDSVQEFQVASNSYSAELGRAGGAVINVVTKSGTNQFHGSVFDFYRDQSMNAYDPIFKIGKVNVPHKPKYHFNQFGGTFGGPIKKNRAFFFFDYDGQRNTQPNIFTFTPPAAIVANPSTNQSRALAYLTPRTATFSRGLNQDAFLTKVDYNLTQRNQLSVRWNDQRFTGKNFENAGNTNAQEHTGDSLVQSDTITGQLTSTLSNSVVNVLRVSYLRDKEPGKANSNLPEAVVKEGGVTLLNIGRNNFSPRETTIHREQYGDSITWAFHRHTFKAGGDVIVDKIFNYFPGVFSGTYTFNSLEDFGKSLANDNTAAVTYQQNFAGTGTTGGTTHPDMLQPAFFLQDD